VGTHGLFPLLHPVRVLGLVGMRGLLPEAFLDGELMAGSELALGMLRSISRSVQAWLGPRPHPLSTATHCCDRERV